LTAFLDKDFVRYFEKYNSKEVIVGPYPSLAWAMQKFEKWKRAEMNKE